MTFKEYHQNSHKEQALDKNKCNCEIIYILAAIDFHDELIAMPPQGEARPGAACTRVFL
ncbi:hypothetical protein O0880_19995 [Janthinobacterium sp. SUN118]|uniref:hypothetical protein n=1 Tax=Janthinobacterium sp. SUN118 TaxID=3004100 RepID=UPI0025AFC090|nr:hypothetical protein [Janthinobacterium sp. SUN118]MDN2711708.1 hypothetical protein [Janthinobacterium sp. SUN118]